MVRHLDPLATFDFRRNADGLIAAMYPHLAPTEKASLAAAATKQHADFVEKSLEYAESILASQVAA
jgi:hypothetical protein